MARDVIIQNKTDEPMDALFNKSVSNFSLSVATVASDATTLVYTFTAAVSHGINAGNEILLLDVA